MASARAVRRGLVVVAVLAVVAVAVWEIPKLYRTAKNHFVGDTCTIGDYSLQTDQASVAATMVGEVTQFRVRLPERAAVLVLAAGLQESKLTNLAPGDGDRDSVGVLQQRPSQGWGGGKAKVLTDVGEATREFLEALIKVPHWRTRPLAQAVQAVQISADGSAYAQHEPEAQALADALIGKRPRAITCDIPAPTVVARARTVARQAADELGIDTPRAHGTRVQVHGAGWQTVAWFVANADRLGIERVAFNGWVWTRTDGWQRGSAAASQVVATLATLSPAKN